MGEESTGGIVGSRSLAGLRARGNDCLLKPGVSFKPQPRADAADESHNLLRFDNSPQRVDARAEIRPIATETDSLGFVVDLSPVVRDQVASAQRQFTLNPDGSVIIRDAWKTADTPSQVVWQWLTYATASTEPDGFLLKQSERTPRLHASA